MGRDDDPLAVVDVSIMPTIRMATPALEIKHLHVRYGESHILHGVNLQEKK